MEEQRKPVKGHWIPFVTNTAFAGIGSDERETFEL